MGRGSHGQVRQLANVRAWRRRLPDPIPVRLAAALRVRPVISAELRGYADDLRREREAMLAAGAADWAAENVTRQLEIITSHIRTHEAALDHLPAEQRAVLEEASATVRRARRLVPVTLGRPAGRTSRDRQLRRPAAGATPRRPGQRRQRWPLSRRWPRPGIDQLPLRRSARRSFRLPALRRRRSAQSDHRGTRPSAPGLAVCAARLPLARLSPREEPARRPCQRQGTESPAHRGTRAAARPACPRPGHHLRHRPGPCRQSRHGPAGGAGRRP